MIGISPDGLISCAANSAEVTTDVTAVEAGEGLIGAEESGRLVIDADTTYLQRRITGRCRNDQYVVSISSEGSIICDADAGDVSSVIAGEGLGGGGTSGSVTLTSDTSYLQRRVADACSVGTSIRAINQDGTVLCESAGVGATQDSDWVVQGSDMHSNVVGNVGIGTASPVEALDVAGNVHASGGFIAGSTTAYLDGFITPSPGTDLDIDSGTLFIANSTNSVGVGLTSPKARLHVAGDAIIQGAVSGVTTLDTGEGVNELHPMDQGVRTSDDVRFTSVDATLFREGGSTKLSNDIAGNSDTATALAANGFNCAPGSYPLGVDAKGGAEGCTDEITGNSGTATALAANGLNCASGSYPLGVDARGVAEGCTVDDDAPDSDSEVPDFISINNGRLFALAGAGNVGIGTPSPQALLHVVGGENNGTAASLRITGSNAAQHLLMDGNEIDALADGLFLNNNSPEDVILAMGGGNVGVGTVNPTALLHVVGGENNGATASLRITGSNAAQHLLMDGNEIDALADGLFLNNNSDQKVILATGGGNVGIGTAFPQSRLQVSGGYVQILTVSGNEPDSLDCNSAAEAGRMVVRTDGITNFYVCSGVTGWVGVGQIIG